MVRTLTPAAVVLSLLTLPVFAGDWPSWRGPNRDAISTETGLLKEWPEKGPPLAWEAKGLGRGYSSVAVAGGKVFTCGERRTKADQKGGQHLICFDADKGTELWSARISDSGEPNCTPTVDGDLVFALGRQGDLICASTADGAVKWKKNFRKDKEFDGHMMSDWGYSESPLVDGDRLIVTPGGKKATLAALAKKTGDVIWKCPIPEGDGAAYSSVVISNAAGVKQYVQLLGGGIVGVRAKDGELLWRYDKIANGTANIPTPITKDDYVFCSTGYDTGAALLKLEKTTEGVKAKEVYFLRANELQNHHGGMILVGDHVYGGHGHNDGRPFCLDLETGKMAWKQGRGPGEGSAAVVCADGHIYFRYESGKMALVEATPKGYTLKSTFKIPHGDGPSWPHPVIANGKLYLREGDWLLCYDVKAK